MNRPTPRIAVLAVTAVIAVALSACGSSVNASPATPLRLGYLPNLTHATAIVGVNSGFFAQSLGSSVKLSTETFNAGPAAAEALVGNALDAGFIGPNPAINAFIKTHGAALRIIAGATLGGSALVVRPDAGIAGPSDLRGKRIATPQLGNTQDVALRTYLGAHGIHTTPQGDGDTTILSADNATIVQLFKQKKIDGAWMPEPYVSVLIDQAGGRLLVDEATLWPGGQFITTLLVVRTQYLKDHPDVVGHLLEGHLAATQWTVAHPGDAKALVNAALASLTQKKLPNQVVGDAWSRLHFTLDPVPAALGSAAANAHTAGLLADDDLHGIVDLGPLNGVLAAHHLAPVSDAGLGASP